MGQSLVPDPPQRVNGITFCMRAPEFVFLGSIQGAPRDGIHEIVYIFPGLGSSVHRADHGRFWPEIARKFGDPAASKRGIRAHAILGVGLIGPAKLTSARR